MGRRAGFTLMEMLIVIGIIVVLSSITIPAVFAVRRKSEVKRMKTFLDTVKLQLENYSNDFGDYPPSRPASLGLGSNGVNDGIECLVRCLTTKKKSGPYFTFDDLILENADTDTTKGKNPTDSAIAGGDLFEIKDSWGNPFIYIHNQDYEIAQTYLVGEQREKTRVRAKKSEKTKEFLGLRSFQLLSLGPDGKPDDAPDGDDLVVFGGN